MLSACRARRAREHRKRSETKPRVERAAGVLSDESPAAVPIGWSAGHPARVVAWLTVSNGNWSNHGASACGGAQPF